MSLYSDEIEKLNYYREQIIELMAKNGELPNDMEVQKRLESIDTRLAVFQYDNVVSGEPFDTTKFNEDMAAIRQDLLILYKLAYTQCIEEYQKLEQYIDTHLKELEILAKHYKLRTDLELSITSLGKTIYFKTSGFQFTEENTVAHVQLGKIEASAGSKLACLFEGRHIRMDQVVFNFGNQHCLPYSYNRDFFQVSGDPTHFSYPYERQTSADTGESTVEMAPDGFVPDKNNSYIIYTSKDAFQVQNEYGSEVEHRISGLANTFTGSGRIVFYIVNGTYASFEFGNAPVKKNFDGTMIENMPKHQKITMSYTDGLSFSVNTNGTIYAMRANGVISGNKLYYTYPTTEREFLIEEYTNDKKVSYDDASITISGLTAGTPLDITSIAIKEVEVYDEVEV